MHNGVSSWVYNRSGAPHTRIHRRRRSTMPPAKRARAATSNAASDEVTLLVGKDKETLTTEAALLRNASEYFAAALSHGFKEAAERVIELPESDPADIRLLIELVELKTFVKPDNAISCRRLFSEFSMRSSLIEHAEDIICATREQVDEEIGAEA